MLIGMFFKERRNIFPTTTWDNVCKLVCNRWSTPRLYVVIFMFAPRWSQEALWTLLAIGTSVWFLPRERISPSPSASLLGMVPAPPSRLYTEVISWIKLAPVPCSAVSLLSLQFWMTSSQPCSTGSLWRNCSNPKSSTPKRPWGLSMTVWLMPPSWDWTRPAWIRWADSCLHPPWVAFLVSFVDYCRLESHIMYAKVPCKSKRHL